MSILLICVFRWCNFIRPGIYAHPYKAYETWGLNVNVNKTVNVVVNSDARFEVLIKDSTSIEQVVEFKYLGALITRQGLGKPEIKKRIEQSRKFL